MHMQFLLRATHAIPFSQRKGNHLGAFLGLLVPDNSESLLSEQRPADTDLFHIKPQWSGTTRFNLSTTPHLDQVSFKNTPVQK